MMRGRHSIMDAYAEAFVTNRKALKIMLSEIIASTENIREKEKANGKGPSSLCFAYPETFEEVLKELDGRNPVKSGEDTKLWEELKKAKDDLETLLTAIYSSAGISSIAFLADTDQAKSTDFIWEEDEKCWEAPSVSHSSIHFSHVLSLLEGRRAFHVHGSDRIHRPRIKGLSTIPRRRPQRILLRLTLRNLRQSSHIEGPIT